ncbi:P-loop NTPase fold protein [Gottfriedia sp. S16(2024)]|uniref:KAP family P-loop NTPase fold protein n=1 Tax=Gottfriedia sp. S16(2024) TaxID=3162883 RepID=UPI003D1EBB76
MNIRSIVEMPLDNPFSNDKLNREEFKNNLMNILDRTKDNLVICLNSSWGTGKTTFIKMWKTSLCNNEEYSTLYFNAWENDDVTDPLIPLLSLLENNNSLVRKAQSSLLNLTKIAAPIIATATLGPLAGHIADVTSKFMNKSGQKIIEESTQSLGEKFIDSFQEQKNSKEQLKRGLKKYQRTVDKKILIFIDELDRCNPQFAIKVLERVKHLFDLENYIFVFSLDREQLSHSISTHYGQNMDSVGYLRRFFDLELSLPLPKNKDYFSYLIDCHTLDYNNIEYFWKLFTEVADLNNFSLRDCDRLFINLKLLLPQIPLFNQKENYSIRPSIESGLYIYLLTLKLKYTDTFEKVIRKSYDSNDINNLLDIVKVPKLSINEKLSQSYEIYKTAIQMFLQLNLHNLNDIDEWNKAHESYIVRIGESEYHGNHFNLINLWDYQKGCSIFNNIQFINYQHTY